MSQTDQLPEFTSSEFDIFARKLVQSAIVETNVVVYKLIASIDHRDLEFVIPPDHDTYFDPDIKFLILGKFTKVDRSALDSKVFTADSNNCLHSLFSQCTIALNGVNIKQ